MHFASVHGVLSAWQQLHGYHLFSSQSLHVQLSQLPQTRAAAGLCSHDPLLMLCLLQRVLLRSSASRAS